MTSWGRTSSSPNLVLSSSSSSSPVKALPSDLSLEGISAEIKLLQKLIKDYHHATTSVKELNTRRPRLMSSILTVLDHLKTKIQSSDSTRRPELRRCHSDLRSPAPTPIPNTCKDENDQEFLRMELQASVVARKSLEAMCSSLGKEKGIIALELARRVQQLNSLEEHVEDLRAQNDSLLAKLRATTDPGADLAALQDRNKALSDQLLKSLDGYRSLKRKYKGAQEEHTAFVASMVEMRAWVTQDLQQPLMNDSHAPPDHISTLLQALHSKLSKHLDGLAHH